EMSATTSRVRVRYAGSVGNGPTLRRGIAHLSLGLRLTWLAFRLRPDVLYAFKPKAYAGLCLLIFWLLRRLGLIRATIALDADDWEGSGGWVDREPAAAPINALVSWHERWCIRHADVVTIASRELIEL